MATNPNTFSDATNSVLSRTKGDVASMRFRESDGSGVVRGSIARERTWKFRATRLHGIKVTRRERPVLRTGIGISRIAMSHENGWWSGVKRQKKRTSPRSRRDHAKYKEGSERKVHRLKGRSVGP